MTSDLTGLAARVSSSPASPLGLKFDSEKPDYSLLDFPYIESLIAVLTHGATKYARDNWKLFHPSDIPRFASAIMRHTAAILQGELIDPDSGLPHASHIEIGRAHV